MWPILVGMEQRSPSESQLNQCERFLAHDDPTLSSQAVNWTYLHGNWVLMPQQPLGLIHFLGGAFVASAPQFTYNDFLYQIATQRFGVIATPFLVQPNHYAIAQEVTQTFNRGLRQLQQDANISSCPIFGMGHSLGAKLQLLLSCQKAIERQGNILMAFNNFDSDRAIPFAEALTPWVTLSFSPSPQETIKQVQTKYHQPQTLVVRFQTDTLDESDRLIPIFQSKFPSTFMHQKISGDHLTPLEPNVSPTSYRKRLEDITIKWLNYQRTRVH